MVRLAIALFRGQVYLFAFCMTVKWGGCFLMRVFERAVRFYDKDVTSAPHWARRAGLGGVD